MIKMLINLSFVIIFHVQIQRKTTNLSFCVIFVSIKLPQHEFPKSNYCLNDTIIFLLSCCIFSCRQSKKYTDSVVTEYRVSKFNIPWSMTKLTYNFVWSVTHLLLRSIKSLLLIYVNVGKKVKEQNIIFCKNNF